MQVSYTKCVVTMASSYLKQHMASLHGICVPQTIVFKEEGEVPTTYVVSFPKILQSVRYPVPECLAVSHSA